ncbi:MAG: MBL fold metallo-hydrolase [Vicinamibacterales bacterium]
MKSRTLFATIALISAIGCTPPPPGQQFLTDAVAALGGRSRIEAAKTLVIEGKGVNYNLGQDMTPEAATQTFEITGYVRKIDLANRRQRIEQTRTPKFAYFQGPQPQTQIQALDGDVAFNVNPAGDASRAAAAVETDRRFDLYHHPLALLRAATDARASVTNVRSVGAIRQADIMTAAGIGLTMTVDATGLPLSISSKTDHANLGDVVLTTTFADYQDVSGLKLPAHFTGKVDEFTTWDLQAARQTLDTEVGDLAAPAAVTSKPAPAAAANVTAEQVGTGVWFLAGQSHHSVLVEFADHLMLIEAPQSEARTLAVIAKAKQTVPGKPLTQLVTTHHHFDHTAGLRTAIVEGLTIIRTRATRIGSRTWRDGRTRSIPICSRTTCLG